MLRKVNKSFDVVEYKEEEKWLEAQYRKGLGLRSKKGLTYHFEVVEPKILTYRIDYEKRNDYKNSLVQIYETNGWSHVYSHKSWHYFLKPDEDGYEKDRSKKNIYVKNRCDEDLIMESEEHKKAVDFGVDNILKYTNQDSQSELMDDEVLLRARNERIVNYVKATKKSIPYIYGISFLVFLLIHIFAEFIPILSVRGFFSKFTYAILYSGIVTIPYLYTKYNKFIKDESLSFYVEDKKN